jgi:glycerol-3-phosphate dehydrogenase (NAD(P)+)
MNLVVIGAGAWGTAFALHLARIGHTVSLAPRRLEQAVALASDRRNPDYLPGFDLPPSLQIGHELAPLLMEADAVVLACPSQALRATAARLEAERGTAARLRLIVSLAKGLEAGSHLRPSQVVASILPDLPFACLTGPTNAAEVARGLPAAMVLAGDLTNPFLREAQAALSSAALRVYLSGDLAGAEFGGCLKNIYAIAAGCADGLGLGDNTKAALLTRALAEMVRLGTALGAQPETFYGLSGFGDLVATCSGAWSRNRGFGERIGRGARAEEIIASSRSVVEGYRTTESFHGLCRERGIDAPILAQIYRILFEGLPPASALAALMTRELKRE